MKLLVTICTSAIFKEIILSIVFFLQSFHSYAQQRLVVSAIGREHKSFTIKRGHFLELHHIDSLGRNPEFKRVYGKVVAVEDSSITLKHFFSRKRSSFPLHTIARIKREYFAPYVLGGLGLEVASFLILDHALGDAPYLLVIIPPVAFMVFFEKVINPPKNINRLFWKGKNKWELTISSLN